MKRTDKVTAVERMTQEFRDNPHVIVSSFRGLKVNQANELRRKIDAIGGKYTVVKNRLARLAAAGTPAEGLTDQLDGPSAVATHDQDPVALAKTLSEFAKDNPQIELLAGLIDGKAVIDVSGIKQLAALPGLLELRAQLLSLIQTPATQVVRLLNTPGGQMARVIDARRETMGDGEAQSTDK